MLWRSRVLPFDAGDAEYAKIIAEIYQDDQRYAELVTSSRAAFDERLNWDAWGITVAQIIKDLLDREILPTGARHSSHRTGSV